MKIVIESEQPGGAGALFRVLVDDEIVDSELTAAQAHNIVGDVLEPFLLPNGRSKNIVELSSHARAKTPPVKGRS